LSSSHISNIYPCAYSRTALAAQKNASRTDTFVLMVCITYYYYYYYYHYNLETWKIDKRGRRLDQELNLRTGLSSNDTTKKRKWVLGVNLHCCTAKIHVIHKTHWNYVVLNFIKLSKHSSNIKLFHVQIVALNQIYGLHK